MFHNIFLIIVEMTYGDCSDMALNRAETLVPCRLLHQAMHLQI